ncbi:sugar transferase [Ramlibacter agri]|nr:sugar transferase [Ramlibacter agri]
MDVLLAAIALVLLSPVLLLVALAVALESGWPVLFKQQRVGQGEREFGIYKFRSMVKNAAAIGPYHTSANDPRITRVGRFIRRTSLDELPQLLNVLKGDMSLVGPRPDVPAQRALYTPQDWRLRCSVRPGITGLAQALLRSEATTEQRRDLDLRYVREHSVGMDLRIMALTVGRLAGKGSN